MDEVEAFATDDLRARVLLSLATEPGHPVGGELIRTHGAVETVPLALRTGPEAGHTPAARWLRDAATGFDVDAAHYVLEDPLRDDTRLITPEDPAWPERLMRMGDFGPWAVWVTGDEGRLQESTRMRQVAITGSEYGSSLAELTARDLADDLVQAGCGVISTGQHPVGTGAVGWAMYAGGSPIVVLPASSFGPAPGREDELFEQVAAHGVIISELAQPLESPVRRGLQRDRLLTAFADAVVIVQAEADSECLQTAQLAHQVGVPVGAIPAITDQTSSLGCARLIRDGIAEPIQNADGAIELLNAADHRGPQVGGPGPERSRGPAR